MMGHVIRAKSSLPQMQIKLNVYPSCVVFVRNYCQVDSVLIVSLIHGSTMMAVSVWPISVHHHRSYS